MTIPENLQKLIDREFVFEDGNSMKVTEVKRRDENQYWITYFAVRGAGIPQQYKMESMEFLNTYGHLFP